MYKIATNRQHNIDVKSIYSIEKKKWGSVWVRYVDKKNNKKISRSREDIFELCCKVNIFRILQNLSKIIPTIER